MYAAHETMPVRARLHAALESLETTGDLIREVREVESFRARRSELRSAADLVAEARALVQVLLRDGGEQTSEREARAINNRQGSAAGTATLMAKP
jgi:hypothetical protein